METLYPSENKVSDQRPLDNLKVPPDITTLVEPTPQYPRPDDTVIAHQEANKQTFINKTSYDPERYHEVYGTLLQYVNGTPLKVTYYKQIHPDTGERTAFGDSDFNEDDVHFDYEEILNFEIRVESQFSFSWDSDKSVASFTGEGIVYPGFEAAVDDLFVYKIHDAFGLFKITSVEPFSIRQGSYHRITFRLMYRLGPDEQRNLRRRVRSTAVFDVQKYLSGNLTLLEYDTYLVLEKLRETRISLARHFSDKFYDSTIESYIRPDGVYDPYLVAYMLKKVSTQVVHKRPQQLIIVKDYERSIWSLFTYQSHLDLESVHPSYEVVTKEDSIFGTQINGLINRPFLRIASSVPLPNPTTSGNGSTVTTRDLHDAAIPAKDTETLDPAVIVNQNQIDEYEALLNKNAPETLTAGKPKYNIRSKDPVSIKTTIEKGSKEDLQDPDVIVRHDNFYYYKPTSNIPYKRLNYFKQPSIPTVFPPYANPPIIPAVPSDTSKKTEYTCNPYVFSYAFYAQQTNLMTTLERLVYDYLTTGKVDAGQVCDLVTTFRRLSDEDLYYHGAVYLHLIDVAIRGIR